jgi:ubiquinone/menaquinone biosynthesis C-methylase UbiE
MLDETHPFDHLHKPLMPVLQHLLESADVPRTGVALDVGCGNGHKLPLLMRACGPEVSFVGLDIDALAIQKAMQSSGVRDQAISFGIVGNALALPLRDGSCDSVFCIAALGLFDDRLKALGELRRVMRPGGRTIVVTASQVWAFVTRWPPDLANLLEQAYLQVLQQSEPLPASPDVVEPLQHELAIAGFSQSLMRAFLQENVSPIQAELMLLPWPPLRQLLSDVLSPESLMRCDLVVADLELCSVVVAAWAS